MAFVRLIEIIAFLIYSQEIYGQLNSLLNNSPLRQNSLSSQGFESTTGIKSIKDTLFQNEHFGKTSNFNSQNQANSQQSPIPQPTVGPSAFPSQQPQNFHPILNQQPSQIPELPQPVLYQPQPFLQQSFTQSSVTQQPYNYMEPPTAFTPVIKQTPDLQQLNPQQYSGNINFQQLPTGSAIQTVPVQFSQPLTNSFVPTYSSLSSVPTCGSQRIEYVSNYGSNYASPVTTIPFSVADGQIITSIPTMPYTAVVSTVNPTMYGNNMGTPYQNQIFEIFEDPFENIREIGLDDELDSFETDNLTSLLVSLLAPKKSPKYIESSYQGSPYASYSPYKKKKGTKPSSLKALLPIIFNLIKERREGCSCRPECTCNRKNKSYKDTAPQISGGYSKKRDYSLKEEMFRSNESDEDIPRITREHKKYKKTKIHIPDVSFESSENVSADDDRVSEEDED